MTQRQSVKDAIWLASEGKSAAGIREILEKNKFESSIYITVGHAEISEKGRKNHTGRCSNRNSPESETGSADPGRKSWMPMPRSEDGKQAKKTMLDAMEKDLLHRFGNQPVHLEAAYTCSDEEAQKWKEEIEDRIPSV